VSDVIQLTVWDLLVAALLVLVPAAMSLFRGWGLHGQLLVGALRCLAQLLLVGYVIRFVFELDSAWIVLGVIVVMIAAGAWIASRRTEDPPPGLLGLSALSIGVTSFLGLFFVSAAVIHVEPWYAPRYLIPLAGMVVGNAMNSAALAAERLASEMRHRRREIETLLALGATPSQASRDAGRAAVRACMIPNLNALLSIGVVHLPGMMTGQILSGTSPLMAVRYQLVIMYVIVFAAALTASMITSLGYRRYFTARMQLDHARFADKG
jgi:putative ABC transport system permease protein